MARRIIGLDLGAYSLKLLRMESGKQFPKFEILDAVEEVLSPEEDEGPSLLERQKEALLRLQAKGLIDAEAFATGLAASEGQVRRMEVPFVEARKIEAILPGLLESEVPFDVGDMVVSWHREEKNSDAAKKDENIATAIRVGFGKKSSIAESLHLLQAHNIDPRQMHLSSAALYEIVREFGSGAIIPANGEGSCGAIVDFGHRTTNLCIFDAEGFVSVHSFYRGGKKLTEEIAKKLDISFAEAQELKHSELNFEDGSSDPRSRQVIELAKHHHAELLAQINRIFITTESAGFGPVKGVAFTGGGARIKGIEKLFKPLAEKCEFIQLASFFPAQLDPYSMALALSYALGLLHLHSKDSRFNFRRDEFVWRGELDFLRTKSVPLILWGLTIICSLTIMWSAMSLVLDKENKSLDEQLKQTCSMILRQPNVPAKKCLAMMKEQIASHVDMGIPDFTASDVYVKLAAIPPSINIVISELDILEKRVRIAASSPNYEDIDKVTAILRKIPCFVKLETGRTEKTDKGVKYNLSFDIDCSTSPATPAKAG